jgi:hypothetical protein
MFCSYTQAIDAMKGRKTQTTGAQRGGGRGGFNNNLKTVSLLILPLSKRVRI